MMLSGHSRAPGAGFEAWASPSPGGDATEASRRPAAANRGCMEAKAAKRSMLQLPSWVRPITSHCSETSSPRRRCPQPQWQPPAPQHAAACCCGGPPPLHAPLPPLLLLLRAALRSRRHKHCTPVPSRLEKPCAAHLAHPAAVWNGMEHRHVVKDARSGATWSRQPPCLGALFSPPQQRTGTASTSATSSSTPRPPSTPVPRSWPSPASASRLHEGEGVDDMAAQLL